MRLDELPTSDRIEDRRGLPGGRAGLGIGTVVILGLIGWALGIDPRVLIGGAEMMSQNGQTQQQADAGRTGPTGAPSDEMGRFVSAILGSTEAEWIEIFAGAGKTYRPPTLVLFSGATQSGCGFAKAAMGPFYCPIDQEGLSRHKFLSRPRAALSCVRRREQVLPVLGGLCDCPRDRSPRAESTRTTAEGAGGAAGNGKGRRQ